MTCFVALSLAGDESLFTWKFYRSSFIWYAKNAGEKGDSTNMLKSPCQHCLTIVSKAFVLAMRWLFLRFHSGFSIVWCALQATLPPVFRRSSSIDKCLIQVTTYRSPPNNLTIYEVVQGCIRRKPPRKTAGVKCGEAPIIGGHGAPSAKSPCSNKS